MIRTLLATTALAALLTTGAIAQTTPPPAPPAPADPAAPMAPADPAAPMAPADPAAPMAPADPAAPMAPAAPATTEAAPDAAEGVDATEMQETDVMEPWDMSAGYVAVDTDNLGSQLIDQPVYSAAGEEAEEIGNITDIIFTEGGDITGVVVGVGGFLGIGEKSVAVPFDMLEFTLAADNTERWVVPTTADALTAAPDFVWETDEPADAMAPADGGAMAPADGGAMAPAAPADGGAMAPAAPATN